ncbi:MAG TPA: anion transporter [Methylomirabilota bacterium]|jgi:Na+/H+ antiporter NhaD/arsenite permease-like protein
MDEANLHRLIAVVVFAGTYLGLALGRLPFLRVDRTGVAIIGGAVMVVSGVVPWDRAVAAVDAHTLVLLFGMMIVAAYLRLSGFFRLVTYTAVRRAHTPVGLLALIVLAAGVLSALFVNDVVCLVMAPIVLDLVRQLRLPPTPYLIALATAANVGSVATLTGNPQNMLVGSFSGIGYRTFLLREAPVAVIGLVLVFAIIWLVYRRRLPADFPSVDLEERFAVHRALMTKTIAAVSVMLVAFLAGVPIALVAIAGAACCLLTRRVNPDKVYREIDWGLLVLFTGLFVVIAGVEQSGLTAELLGWTSAIGLFRPAVLTVVTAALSNLVSNVPAVLLFKTVIPTFGEPVRAWLILAMASTMAGNLTIVGSVANLIVVEQARGAGIRIGFLEHGKVGVPITVATLVVGWLLLIL